MPTSRTRKALIALALLVIAAAGAFLCEDYEIARPYRDVRVTTIYEATSEMQQMAIARHLLRTK